MNAIIALNPQQMQEAQVKTTSWVDAKLESAKADHDTADEIYDSMMRASLSPASAKRQMQKAAARVRFYEKVKAALAAGYVIIPPFGFDIFAIRTDRNAPVANKGDSAWAGKESARPLSVGAGVWRDPEPLRYKIGTEQKPTYDGKSTREVAIYETQEWRDEIDLPVIAQKPQIIDAVGRALHEKIFDALGIAPATRAPDPIIAGEIRRPDGRGSLTFMVAWWLDEADLP